MESSEGSISYHADRYTPAGRQGVDVDALSVGDVLSLLSIVLPDWLSWFGAVG